MVLNTAIRLPVSTYKVLTFFAILYVFFYKKAVSGYAFNGSGFRLHSGRKRILF